MHLTHPVSGEPLILDAPLADDFVAVIDALGWTNEWRSYAALEGLPSPGTLSGSQTG